MIAWLCWLALEAIGAVAVVNEARSGAWGMTALLAVCMLALLLDWCREAGRSRARGRNSGRPWRRRPAE